jgi:hypothetical protein
LRDTRGVPRCRRFGATAVSWVLSCASSTKRGRATCLGGCFLRIGLGLGRFAGSRFAGGDAGSGGGAGGGSDLTETRWFAAGFAGDNGAVAGLGAGVGPEAAVGNSNMSRSKLRGASGGTD